MTAQVLIILFIFMRYDVGNRIAKAVSILILLTLYNITSVLAEQSIEEIARQGVSDAQLC